MLEIQEQTNIVRRGKQQISSSGNRCFFSPVNISKKSKAIIIRRVRNAREGLSNKTTFEQRSVDSDRASYGDIREEGAECRQQGLRGEHV